MLRVPRAAETPGVGSKRSGRRSPKETPKASPRARQDEARHPIENAFIESFNGQLRDERLNTNLFFSIDNAWKNSRLGGSTSIPIDAQSAERSNSYGVRQGLDTGGFKTLDPKSLTGTVFGVGSKHRVTEMRRGTTRGVRSSLICPSLLGRAVGRTAPRSAWLR